MGSTQQAWYAECNSFIVDVGKVLMHLTSITKKHVAKLAGNSQVRVKPRSRFTPLIGGTKELKVAWLEAKWPGRLRVNPDR